MPEKWEYPNVHQDHQESEFILLLWCIHATKYDSELKKNELLMYAMIWMNVRHYAE